MRLIYNGKESGNELTVRDCSYHKGCLVRVLQKGCRGVAPVVEPEAKEHAAASSRARYEPFLRATVEGDKEFDGSDGWAVAEDIHVAEAQEWFRRSHKGISWDTWPASDNKLQYFLAKNRGVHFPEEVAHFLNEHLKTTQRLDATRWGAVPQSILEIDAQLRSVLVDPRLESNPLLGSAEDIDRYSAVDKYITHPRTLPVIADVLCGAPAVSAPHPPPPHHDHPRPPSQKE